MSSPQMTFPAASGNALASQSLAASGTVTFTVDGSAKEQLQLAIENTPGSAVSTTRGLKIEAFLIYTSGGTTATLAQATYALPSNAASTLESWAFMLPTGKWKVKLTNLDATNAVTVSATVATIDGYA